MPASDPTPGVPTPTGTLQGVAAFSWDGANWQPAAGAGPDVATPTGVLRGVAPFSWDGAAWQPAGRAQPGVAAPGGVLDGVAVYTWSGTAWTPASGQPTPSTPSGALRGVAAFNWDGAAWQPAGRAGPSVATPYGVLDGVAMFGWTGSAWTPAPTLDISLMTPGVLDPRITFTRGSAATYFDVTGTMQTVSGNTPRWDYDPNTHMLNGLFIEEPRTNLLLNSATLGTQSVAVTAQAYTLSFYGTGTITKSGAASGALVGTGAFPQRVSQTFTPSAGTLTCTVTGSVLSAQLEAGGFVTSYIPTTAATVTRGWEVATLLTNPWFSLSASTLVAETIHPVAAAASSHQVMVCLDDGSATNRVQVYRVAGTNNVQNLLYGSGTLSYAPTMSGLVPGAVTKAGVAWRSGQQLSVLNGVTAGADVQTTVPVAATTLRLGLDTGSADLNGYIRRVRYWQRVLSNAEMQAVTT